MLRDIRRGWWLATAIILASCSGDVMAASTEITGTVRIIGVMGHQPSDTGAGMLMVLRVEYWLEPADPEDGWRIKRKADHPSRSPAIRLDDYRGPTGKRVKVKGRDKNGEAIDVESVEEAPLNLLQRFTTLFVGTPTAPAATAHRGIIIPGGWSNKPLPTSVTADTARAAWTSIAKLDLEQDMLGRATHDFDAAPPVVFEGLAHCRAFDLWQEAVDAHPEINWALYDNLDIVASTSGCFGGIGTVGRGMVSTLSGGRLMGLNWNLADAGPEYAAVVAVHELGHNGLGPDPNNQSGVWHTHLVLDGTTTRFGHQFNPAYRAREYGGQASVMGTAELRGQKTCSQKLGMGILRRDEVQVVTASGDYDFGPVEDTAAIGVKCIQVRRGAGPEIDLYVESHKVVPGSRWATDPTGQVRLSEVLQGVLLYIPHPREGMTSPAQFDPVVSIGGQPESLQGALKSGQAWTDAITQHRVETLAYDPVTGRARVRVTFGRVDSAKPTSRWLSAPGTVVRRGTSLSAEVLDESGQVLVRHTIFPSGVETTSNIVTTGTQALAVDPCVTPAGTTQASVWLASADGVGNLGPELGLDVGIDRTGCDGGTTTTTTTVPVTTTTRSSTSTTTIRATTTTTTTGSSSTTTRPSISTTTTTTLSSTTTTTLSGVPVDTTCGIRTCEPSRMWRRKIRRRLPDGTCKLHAACQCRPIPEVPCAAWVIGRRASSSGALAVG